ncbi:hypothetical protein, variant [Verruconis gallopava]|uniref:Major facilitator superfamily (MFS) profile domain-containing protein n=1 Tax=Verruconis gallopava TaxID=253628 RepID=A0A0D2B3I5_9PEZI|nr:hypothetical protein, variant [Verruconis gallopava]KIW05834.1 hypothetical protein, variant [Verruconis gallopava]
MELDGSENDEDATAEQRSNGRLDARLSAFVLLLLLSLQALGLKIMYLPLNRLIEDRFCRDYYTKVNPGVIPVSGSVPEQLCKVDVVQQQLASLFGAIESVHLFIDLVVVLPYGIISDRGHRKLVLILNFFGFIAMYSWLFGMGSFATSVSPTWMLVGPVFSLFGGGECVFMSTISALVTDFANSDIERTNMFAYISSITYVVHLISPSLAALTMSRSLRLPFVLGLVLLIVAIPLITLLPKDSNNVGDDVDSEIEPLLDNGGNEEELPKGNQRSHTRAIHDIRSKVETVWKQVSGRKNFQLLLGVFFVAALASSNSPLFPQYISKRYDWTFASAGYLLSIKAAVNVTLLALIVPTVVQILSKRLEFTSGRINRLGAEIMLAISIAGAVFIALSPGVPCLIFGRRLTFSS